MSVLPVHHDVYKRIPKHVIGDRATAAVFIGGDPISEPPEVDVEMVVRGDGGEVYSEGVRKEPVTVAPSVVIVFKPDVLLRSFFLYEILALLQTIMSQYFCSPANW